MLISESLTVLNYIHSSTVIGCLYCRSPAVCDALEQISPSIAEVAGIVFQLCCHQHGSHSLILPSFNWSSHLSQTVAGV